MRARVECTARLWFNLISFFLCDIIQMRKFCALPHNRAKFVASGAFQRQPAHYLGDRHHLNVEGHAHLARLLAPALVKSI